MNNFHTSALTRLRLISYWKGNFPFIRFISWPTWYTYIFLFTSTIFGLFISTCFGPTGPSSGESNSLFHEQLLAPFPRSLICRAWPLVLDWVTGCEAHARCLLYNCSLSVCFLAYRNFISWFILYLTALFLVFCDLVLLPFTLMQIYFVISCCCHLL
jgi:hypothetical protein